jgi:glutamyl-tRNA synthetase
MIYRGRIAPTPTGHLHLGHAATFSQAHRRAREAGGEIFLRIEDLDPLRCKEEFTRDAMEDLRWSGLDWDGEAVIQSTRRELFLDAWKKLRDGGFIYPYRRSRREISTLAPHEEEPVFPIGWRTPVEDALSFADPDGVNWRFKVPDARKVHFKDGYFGDVSKTTLTDFGDFLIWNRDNIPAYELAVVVDDIAMGITEVVRGADLLTSTARQILLYEALGAEPPSWYHCPLVCDSQGTRLAKRTGGLSIRELRAQGKSPAQILEMAAAMQGRFFPAGKETHRA